MEPFSQIELQLAARNHGMPLEALRYPVTPVGLHYLLTHYDIPAVDPASFELAVEGRVARPLRLGLDDLRARPAVELEVTMECAGNGRAMLSPRPVSQPWLNEAVGTAAWRGTPLAPLVVEALLAKIRELKEQGLTILLAEQGVDFSLALADRVYVLEKGNIRYTGPAAELRVNAALRDQLLAL